MIQLVPFPNSYQTTETYGFWSGVALIWDHMGMFNMDRGWKSMEIHWARRAPPWSWTKKRRCWNAPGASSSCYRPSGRVVVQRCGMVVTPMPSRPLGVSNLSTLSAKKILLWLVRSSSAKRILLTAPQVRCYLFYGFIWLVTWIVYWTQGSNAEVPGLCQESLDSFDGFGWVLHVSILKLDPIMHHRQTV